MLGDEARLPFRERRGPRLRILQALEQPQVAGSVLCDFPARAVALDAEPALLEPYRAGESVAARSIHQQQQVLALAVTRRVLAVTDVPYVLAERVGVVGGALERIADAQGHHDGVQVVEL